MENKTYAHRDWLMLRRPRRRMTDYLCIRDGKPLIHCKSGDLTTGASCFQEVIGQALKNLGRAPGAPPMSLGPRSPFDGERKYWAGTRIKRLATRVRSGQPYAVTQRSAGHPASSREVHIVVNMLSPADFDAIDGHQTAALIPATCVFTLGLHRFVPRIWSEIGERPPTVIELVRSI